MANLDCAIILAGGEGKRMKSISQSIITGIVSANAEVGGRCCFKG